MKGFAILCVVLGHVVTGYLDSQIFPEAHGILFAIYNLIYAYHMPLFMMISGYVFSLAYLDKQGEVKRTRLVRQIGNNLMVYGLFSIVFGLVNIAFRGLVNTKITAADIFLIWGKPIRLYWYLYDLNIYYILFSLSAVRSANRRWMAGGLLAATIFGSLIDIKWFDASRAFYYALFFYLGVAGRMYPGWVIGNRKLTVASFAIAVALGAAIWIGQLQSAEAQPVALMEIPVVNVLTAGGISLMIWYAFEHCGKLSGSGFFRKIGQHSLEIYVLHCFFTAGFRPMLTRLGICNAYLSAGVNFVLSTAFPLLIASVCRRLHIHDLVFRPFYCFQKRTP